MEQLELFSEPTNELEKLQEEVSMLKDALKNIRKGLFGRYDKHYKELAHIRVEIEYLKHQMGLDESPEKIFNLEKSA